MTNIKSNKEPTSIFTNMKAPLPKSVIYVAATTEVKVAKVKAKKKPAEKHTLSYGNNVSKSLHDELVNAVWARLPTLRHGRLYTLEEIVGRTHWLTLDGLTAGKIMADLVRHNFFPTIRIAKTKHEYPVMYELV